MHKEHPDYLEAQGLLRKLEETDFSYRNPLAQQLVEDVLQDWIQGFEEKMQSRNNGRTLSDFYGTVDEIPKRVMVNNVWYTPYEMLEHVKERNDAGIEIIKAIKDYQDSSTLYNHGRSQLNVAQYFIDISGESGLSKVVMSGKNGTVRGVIEDMLTFNRDSTYVANGLKNAVKILYSHEEPLKDAWFSVKLRMNFRHRFDIFWSKLMSSFRNH